MIFKWQRVALTLSIIALAAIIAVFSLSAPYSNALGLIVRLSALYGYLMLSIAAIMTSFVREVTKILGRPFIKLHHVFAVLGIILITVHPVAYALETMDMTVFLPSFESWYLFWSYAGKPALLILYVAVVAALLRRRIYKYWRLLHGLMNIVLLLGIVHANLVGTDLRTTAINAVFNMLFAASIMAFILRRPKQYRTRMMRRH